MRLPKICCESLFRPLGAFATWKKAELNTKSGTSKVDLAQCVGSYIQAFNVDHLEPKQSVIYTSCQHSEEVSFHKRYLAPTPEPDYKKIDWKLMNEVIDDLAERVKTLGGYEQNALSFQEFMVGKSPRLQRRYRKAYLDIIDNGPYSIEEMKGMKAHVKTELMDPSKPPRMIMGRDTRFTLALGMLAKPLEDAVAKLPQVMIGKNYAQRGEAFAQLVHAPQMAKTDFGKFESTKRPEYRAHVTFKFYRRVMGQQLWAKAFPWFYEQLVTKGHTLRGLKFKFSGCELSGEATTILDNTVDNLILTEYFMRKNGLEHWAFMVIGDDGVINLGSKKKEYVNTYAQLGFDIKFDVVVDYHDVDFCSGKFIQVKPGVFYFVQQDRKSVV